MMSLRLVSSVSNPVSFDDNPVSRLRHSPRHLSAVEDCNPPSRAVGQSGSVMRRRAPDAADHPFIEDLVADESRLDHAAVMAQVESEDIAMVVLAAGKLAIAIREVHVLLGRRRAAWKHDALARCTAKGWIAVQGDVFAALQTFRVTPEGYRAAGLPVPPFIC
jgi:hypothetical protein